MNFIYVTTQEELNRECEILKKREVLGIDTEGENNFHHYGSYLSIIQISDEKTDWIIDVLLLKSNNVNFSPLIEILENKNIVKIFHDVSFDLRVLEAEFGCKTRNLFDTYLALMLLGEKNNNLGNVLEIYFNAKKEKKYQKADWTIRPIDKEMLSYAVGDSKYLIKLKKILEDMLIEKRRLDWAKEEFLKLENAEHKTNVSTFLDIKGAHDISDEARGILKNLFEVREKYAKIVDKPVHFIISSSLLLDFSVNPPKSINDWLKLRGIHPIVKKNAREFYDATISGKKNPIVLEFSERKKMSKKMKALTEILAEERDKIALKENLEKQMILTKDEIKEIVVNNSLEFISKWKKNLLIKYGFSLSN